VSESDDIFEKLNRMGKYRELYEYCQTQEGVNARYWELMSLMWMGEKIELEAKIKDFESYFTGDFWECRYNLVQGLFHWGHETYKAQKFYDKMFELAEKIDDKKGLSDYYIFTGAILTDDEQIKEYYTKGLKLAFECNNTLGIIFGKIYFIVVKAMEGKSEERLKLIDELNDDLLLWKNDFWRSTTESMYGYYYIDMGDPDKGLTHLERALELSQMAENGWEIANTLSSTAGFYLQQGKLNKALEYTQKWFDQEVKMNHKTRIGNALQFFGEIYEGKGELDAALEKYQQANRIYEEEGDGMLVNRTFNLISIGRAYRKKGDVEQALELFQLCYKLRIQMNNEYFLVYPLFNLVSLLSTMDRDRAKVHMSELELIEQNIKNEEMNSMIKYANALYLKSSSKLRDKIQALSILEKLVTQEEDTGKMTLEYIPHLIELLLIEYQSSKEPDTLEEIESYLHKLIKQAKQENQYAILIESYIIQSQLLALNGEFKESEELLNQAIQIGDDKGLELMVASAKDAQQKNRDKIQEMQQLLNKNADLVEKVEHSNLMNYLKRAQDTFVKGS